ncbi:LytTR family DNA-binding domain-containing protein [Paucibacter soli]|uniref:LytTR family DNA-binding domain-containing protein n=1 Tax=Paucibacter soli TaxID=3133433 RepID=UPI0030A5CBD8
MEKTPVQVLIIDGNRGEHAAFAELLEKSSLSKVKVVSTAWNSLLAWNELRRRHIDVVFLDPDTPGLNLQEFCQQMSGLKVVPLLFIASKSTEHCVEAFAVDAVDYLIKPIRKGRLDSVILRLQDRLSLRRAIKGSVPTAKLVSSVVDKPIADIQVSAPRSTRVLAPESILYAKRSSRGLIVRTAGETIEAQGNLAALQKRVGRPSVQVSSGVVVFNDSMSKFTSGIRARQLLGFQSAGAVQVSKTGEWLPVGASKCALVRNICERTSNLGHSEVANDIFGTHVCPNDVVALAKVGQTIYALTSTNEIPLPDVKKGILPLSEMCGGTFIRLNRYMSCRLSEIKDVFQIHNTEAAAKLDGSALNWAVRLKGRDQSFPISKKYVGAVMRGLQSIRGDRGCSEIELRSVAGQKLHRMERNAGSGTVDSQSGVRISFGAVSLPLSDVLYVRADAKRLVIRTVDKSITVIGELATFEQQMGPGFIRVHRNAIVKTAEIREFDQQSAENSFGIPADGAVFLHRAQVWLPVSRRQASEVKRRLSI